VVVSVIGLQPGAPVADVAAGLLVHLRTRVRADVLADPGPESLERAEADLDRVLLVAATDDPHRDFCLRQADQVVLVAHGTSQPPSEAAGLPTGADIVLVGARPAEEVVRGWCEALDPWQVAIVAQGVPHDDLRMLAARIGGWSVGMVMAGGGARGFAHIGVLQELTAAGILVDRVAGASIGSIVAPVWSLSTELAGRVLIFGSTFWMSVRGRVGRRGGRAVVRPSWTTTPSKLAGCDSGCATCTV
jgi:hypothetical protein